MTLTTFPIEIPGHPTEITFSAEDEKVGCCSNAHYEQQRNEDEEHQSLLDPRDEHTIETLVLKINDQLQKSIDQQRQIIAQQRQISNLALVVTKDDEYNEETKEFLPLVVRRGSMSRRLLSGMSKSAYREGNLKLDTFTMMMFSPPITSDKKLLFVDQAWWLGIMNFITQIALAKLVMFEQTDETGIMSIPLHPNHVTVTIAQFLIIPLALITQSDVITSLVAMHQLMDPSRRKKTLSIDSVPSMKEIPPWRVLVPNVLKFFEGLAILFASWIIIVQSGNVVDLLKDFTALFAISSIDDVLFILAEDGHLGEDLQKKTGYVKRAKVEGSVAGKSVKAAMFIILAMMFGGWGFFVLYGQNYGYLFHRFYPDCKATRAHFFFEDGKCDEWMNVRECGFDGIDCEFNRKYPI